MHLRLFVILNSCTLIQSVSYGWQKSELPSLFNRVLPGYYEDLIRNEVRNALTCDVSSGVKLEKFPVDNEGFNRDDLKWILPMSDAWAKFPSGILMGNLVDYGQFDECLSIGTEEKPNDRGVKGKFCNFAIRSTLYTNVTIAWAICIPDACKLVTSEFTEQLTGAHFVISGAQCQTKELNNELDKNDIASIAVFGTILGIILLSSLYDIFLYYTDQETIHPFCIIFSLVTNSKKLFSVSNAPGQISSLHGIRAISLMWIIAGHRFAIEAKVASVNFLKVIEFKHDYSSSYISSARAAVDTFFLFSAFLISYTYFKGVHGAIVKANGSNYVQNPLTWVKIPTFYIHRLIRISPALVALFFVTITFYRRIAAGPIWPNLVDMLRENCTKWWWSFFLYVQNYVNYKEMCIIPSWYISADMQLYLVSPFLIMPLGELYIQGKKKLAYITVCIVILISIMVPMIVNFFREFDVENKYETHHRTSVYVIGILFGMIVIDYTGKKITINRFVNVVLWILSVGAMLAIILTMHDIEINPDGVKNNVYFTFTRPVWSAALCWIVFACHFGYGGPVNWLLSKSIFQVMTKLSFSMYLLHGSIIVLSIGTRKVVGHFSEFSTMYAWCGDYIFTIVASVIWVLCFESPIVGIEKVVFGIGRHPARPAQLIAALEQQQSKHPTIEYSPDNKVAVA